MTKQQFDTPESLQRAKQSWLAGHFLDIEARYKIAKDSRHVSRNSDIPATGASADQHYAAEADYFRSVEIARLLDRDDMIGGAIVTRFVDNVLQGGLTVDPSTGDDGLNSHIKMLWDAWCAEPSQCDNAKEYDFNEMTGQMLRHVIVDGDVLHRPMRDGSIETIEGHRLKTPGGLTSGDRDNVVHGVELDDKRRRVAYWITKDEISPHRYVSKAESVRVPARDGAGHLNVWHSKFPKRSTQTRGFTAFAPVANGCMMHDDIQFAKLVQQQSASVYAFIRERQMGGEFPGLTDEDGVSQVADPCSPGEFKAMKNIAPGLVYTTYPGETIRQWSSNVPNPTFFDHARQIQQLVSVNVGVPLIMLLLDGSETNFSGWRGVMEQAKLGFQRWQRWLRDRWYRRVFLWKLRQWSTPGFALADPLLVAARQRGVDVFAHSWTLPTWPYIEPLTDASADLLESRNALRPMRMIQKSRGRDWDDVHQWIVEDNAKLIRRAIAESQAIKIETGVDVDWQVLAMLPLPEGIQMAIQPAMNEGTNDGKTQATAKRQA